MTKHFLFSTGIENSCPKVDEGRRRVDQMAESKHYSYWREDFELVEELGVRALRYGPPLYNSLLGDGNYDWDFADQAFCDLSASNIIAIADLCYFSVLDWIGDFQNPDFPKRFSFYARPFAECFHGFSFTRL